MERRAERQNSKRGSEMVFDWHKRQTERWVARLGLSAYQALWWAWAKGFVFGLLVYWWLGG